MEIGGTESEITNGGTPVQSLDNEWNSKLCRWYKKI